MKKALVVIDVQNDYFPGGRHELFNAVETAVKIKKVIGKFRESNDEVIYIKHISAKSGNFFEENTFGAEISSMVTPFEGEKIIIKRKVNAFLDTELENHLKSNNIEELIICGMMSHMCVDAFTRAASDKGYKCKVIYDACTTRDIEFGGKIVPAEAVHNSFMAALTAYAGLVDTNGYLA